MVDNYRDIVEKELQARYNERKPVMGASDDTDDGHLMARFGAAWSVFNDTADICKEFINGV